MCMVGYVTWASLGEVGCFLEGECMHSRYTRVMGAIGAGMLMVVLAGCGGENTNGGPTSPARTTAASSSSDAGGSDASGDALDAGGANSDVRTKGLPPENEALKAPDKTDYLGISYPTDQGAQATARYFIDAMYYGYATGDTGPLESVTDHASCVECTELINDIHSWRDEGKYLTPARVKLDDEWTVDKSEDLTKTEYWFTVDELQIRRQDSSIKTVAKTQTASAFHLAFEDGAWVVRACRWEKADGLQE